jgi:PAS domain S-box-containing protein
MLNAMSPRMRITIALGGVLLSVLLSAVFLGIVPDRRDAVLEGRQRLCESLAVNSSVLISRDDTRRLQAILTYLVAREGDLLSAGIRQADGKLIVDVGEHATHWKEFADGFSDDSQIYVPLNNKTGEWGSIEARFQPLSGNLLFELQHNPWVHLVGFVSIVSMTCWYFYLGKLLKAMNPSEAVPGRVRNALDTLAEGLLVVDRKGRIVLCNQTLAQTLGKDADKLVATAIADLPWEHDQSPAFGVRELPWERILGGDQSVTHATLKLRDCNGDLRIFQTNCAPVIGQEDQIRGVVCSFEDVTELESQKTKLAESQATAVAASKAKSEFLANMSHEIRTPMNAILGFTDVLRRGMYEDEAQQTEYLDTIHRSGQHLLHLINDILDLSKVEAGRLEVENILCSPHQLILDVVNTLRVRADEKSIRIDCVTPGGIPEIIKTDQARLRQIITNLVGNAIKFTSKGGVTVSARFLSGDKPKLQIDVADTGVGISEEAQKKVFEPFTQADGSITRKFGGTGLGLTISKQFAQAMGGSLSVRSEAGVGSTFTIVIETGPIDSDVSLLDIRQFGERFGKATAESSVAKKFRFDPSRILLVDDGEANRQLVHLVLQRNGLLVETAVNGQEAVDKAAISDYDVILMDMQMPVMDGYTATMLLRERGVEIPIVALTANAMRGDEERCLISGCSHFLSKPIEIDRLLELLAELLEASECSDEELAAALELPAKPVVMAVSEPVVSESRPVKTIESAKPEPERQDTVLADTSLDGLLESIEPGTALLRRSVESSPVESTLPMDDPEFRAIVVGFVDRLHEQVEAIDVAWQNRNYDELAALAHWLKGAAGTVGFREFTEPGLALMAAAREQRAESIEAHLSEIRSLTARIQIPAGAAT